MRLKGRQRGWSEKSAKAVVAGAGADEATRRVRRAEREQVTEDTRDAKGHASDAGAIRAGGAAHGEAVREPVSDEAGGPPREHQGTGLAKHEAGTGGLLEAALTRENLQIAWKRVKANKATAGADGLDIQQTGQLLQTGWKEIRNQILAGQYRPKPVRRVMIPKRLGLPRLS